MLNDADNAAEPPQEPLLTLPGAGRGPRSAGEIVSDIGMLILAPILIPATFAILTFLEIKESSKKCLDCKSKNLAGLGSEPLIKDEEAPTGGKKRRWKPAPYNFYKCLDCKSLFKSRWGEALLESTAAELAGHGLTDSPPLLPLRGEEDPQL